jgi:hypothetical protein
MFPFQQWSRERATILRGTHLAYLVFMLNLDIVDKNSVRENSYLCRSVFGFEET